MRGKNVGVWATSLWACATDLLRPHPEWTDTGPSCLVIWWIWWSAPVPRLCVVPSWDAQALQGPCGILEAASRIAGPCCRTQSMALQLLPGLVRGSNWGYIHHHQIDLQVMWPGGSLTTVLAFCRDFCSRPYSELAVTWWVGWGRIPECDVCASQMPRPTEYWASFFMVRGWEEKSWFFSPKGISQHAWGLGIPKIFTDLASFVCLTRITRILAQPAPGPNSKSSVEWTCVTFSGIWTLSSSFGSTSRFFLFD